MALHRLSDLPQYTAFLQQNASELANLYDDILINVTGFFREPESFEALRTSVFPEIIGGLDETTHIRVWVPGCWSGEEAYSVAMVLLEIFEERGKARPIQVFGTDVSQKMIDRARAGIYPESITSDVTPDRLRRFFVRFDGGYRVSPTVRERCVFARQDLTHDPPFSRLDLVMCRNLLIYLGETLQRKIVN